MVRIYGPLTTTMRGGIVTMNFYDPEGHLLDYRRVEELATVSSASRCAPAASAIQARAKRRKGSPTTNVAAALAAQPGSDAAALPPDDHARGGKSAGAIRVSFGIASNFADAHRFVEFAASLRDQTRLTIGEATFDIESCRVRDGVSQFPTPNFQRPTTPHSQPQGASNPRIMSNAIQRRSPRCCRGARAFRLESGHHGDTWLNLELLCVQPEPVEQLAAVLADCLTEQPDLVCGRAKARSSR